MVDDLVSNETYKTNAKALAEQIRPKSADGVPENVQAVVNAVLTSRPIDTGSRMHKKDSVASTLSDSQYSQTASASGFGSGLGFASIEDDAASTQGGDRRGSLGAESVGGAYGYGDAISVASGPTESTPAPNRDVAFSVGYDLEPDIKLDEDLAGVAWMSTREALTDS